MSFCRCYKYISFIHWQKHDQYCYWTLKTFLSLIICICTVLNLNLQGHILASSLLIKNIHWPCSYTVHHNYDCMQPFEVDVNLIRCTLIFFCYICWYFGNLAIKRHHIFNPLNSFFTFPKATAIFPSAPVVVFILCC